MDKKLWQNQNAHRRDHILYRLNLAKSSMYACAVDPKTSQCVTEATREADWVLEYLQQLKMGLFHFVDASEVLMQQENVTAHMALSKIDKR